MEWVRGYRDPEFASFGIPKGSRGARLEEAVEAVRRLWAEDNVFWEGEHFSLKGVTINPKPVQQPGPPIWVGGDTLRSVARAARLGDAWLTSPRHSKSFIRKAIEVYKNGRVALGLPCRHLYSSGRCTLPPTGKRRNARS